MRFNFLFTTWEGGGNMTPAVEAARRLVERGHSVRFMSDECNRADAQSAGATFVPWKSAPNRVDRSRNSQTFRDWEATNPQEAIACIVRELWCGPALAYAQDVIQELRRAPADLVVTSEMLFGVMAACESLGQKFAVLSANISITPLPGIPPLGPGFAPARNDQERAMHAEVAAGVQAMFDSGLPALNAARQSLGLAPLPHLLHQFRAASVELLATSKAFDFSPDGLPDHVRYVGPLVADPKWARPWASPWPTSDSRPMVAVGFSTTFQNHAAVLQKVIDALAPLPVRVLVTLGGSIEPGELRASDNCIIVPSAPHSRVMREAKLAITHGGHGTVMQALVNRVPMLVIPHGRDQNDNAVRITERGAGLSLMPDASVDAIREACQRLLNDAHFQTAAGRLGDLVAADAAAPTVAPELEAAAGSKYSQGAGATGRRNETVLATASTTA